jgi:hypothetical protein
MQKEMEAPKQFTEAIDAELQKVTRQSELLQEMMQQQLFFNTAGDRRHTAGAGEWRDRREGERREPHRAVPGRRRLADRRVSLEDRWPDLAAQLSQMVEQQVALLDQRRLVETGRADRQI